MKIQKSNLVHSTCFYYNLNKLCKKNSGKRNNLNVFETENKTKKKNKTKQNNDTKGPKQDNVG